MTKQIPIATRRRAMRGLFTVGQVADILGAPYDTFYWHIKKGYVARPTHGASSRKYFDAEDIERIKKYWQAENV